MRGSDSFFAQLRIALARPMTGHLPAVTPNVGSSMGHQLQVALARQSPAFGGTRENEVQVRREAEPGATQTGHTNLQRADLTSATLRRADLRGANLMTACLHSADLRMADLRGANLTGADLTRADLRMADLRGANCEAAILVSADMRGALIGGTNLSGADMTSADLEGVVMVPQPLKEPGMRMEGPLVEQPEYGNAQESELSLRDTAQGGS